MPNSTRAKLSVLDQFTPDVLGIFWITASDLNRDLAAFEDFNYLFDGLISQYLYGQEITTSKHAHIFFTENYNERIFLAHLRTKNTTKSQIAGDIDEQIALIQAAKSENKTILVFDKTEDQWHSELKKRYPQFEFRVLEV
jgi:hypothetical protein